VGVSGTNIIVPSSNGGGAAFIFARGDTEWSETAMLTGLSLAGSVAIDGTWAMVTTTDNSNFLGTVTPLLFDSTTWNAATVIMPAEDELFDKRDSAPAFR